MGFSSVFIAEHSGIKWPSWFVDNYQELVHFPADGGPISSKASRNKHGRWRDLEEDIQKAIEWGTHRSNFILVYLHECGGITRVQIEKARIVFTEPTGWTVEEGVMHDFWCCNQCSDSAKATSEAV